MFKISRYKPSDAGQHTIDDDKLMNVGNYSERGKVRRMKEDGSGGTGGNVYAVFEKPNGTPATKVDPDTFPAVKWVSVTDKTREPGDMEDRAAKYSQENNLLYINADFSVYNDMTAYLVDQYRSVIGMPDLMQDKVRGWFEQALVETVIGVQGLINRKEWSFSDIDKALSEEALTECDAALSPFNCS